MELNAGEILASSKVLNKPILDPEGDKQTQV